MARPPALPFRQIHLDFHTSRHIPDVGVEFDAREFARTMKAAHVNSVTVFAKCHHGHLYYNTPRPERHPGLRKNLDLLGQQVDALHREGIRAPIYISVQCDEYAADTHPEWIVRDPDGKLRTPNPVGDPYDLFGWQICDMNSPYQEYLAEQTREVLKRFKPVDGLFFDMCWDQPSVSKFALAAMERANLNPEDEGDRKRHAHKVSLDYMKRFHRMVKDASPQATVYFNSRPLSNLHEEIPFQEQVEIEALPTGGWGYMYFPKNVRYARTFGREYLGMTARFHNSWADFGGIKPYAALEYETSQMIAHGAKVSVGDQLHPRGTLDRAAYELIGKVFRRVEEREPWLAGATAVTEIGLFQTGAATGAGMGSSKNATGTDEGATRMLAHLKHQFDVARPDGDWSRFALLVLPDHIAVDAPFARRLRDYVRAGGSVLASGLSGLTPDAAAVTFKELGVRPGGVSPFPMTYIRFGREASTGVPPTDHIAYEPSVRVTPAPGTAAVARVVEPYFARTWRHYSSHQQTPPDRVSRYAAATLRGRVAYVAYPIFGLFANHGNLPYKLLVRNLIDALLPDPVLRVDAPSSTEATVTRQGKRTIVHLLQYCPERRTKDLDIVEDVVPIFDVPISLKLAKAPKRVYLAPEVESVDFRYENGRATLQVPEVRGHAMVVFE